MKTKFILSVLVLILLLTACVTPSALSPTQTPEPLAAAEQVTSPTSTPVAPPPATETPEPVPTATEAVPTEIPFEDLPAHVMAAAQPETLFASVSPDGNWQADIVRYDCVAVDPVSGAENAYEQLIITHLSDSTQTVVADQLQYCGGLGAAGFNEYYWSANSRYYYFNKAREGVPDGQPCYLWDGEFSRVDVETSLVERVPGNGTQFNAEGTALGWDKQEIVIWNLNEGETGRVPFVVENLILQGLQISPEGDQFVYLLGDNCSPNNSTRTVVVLVSLADLTQTVLVDSETLAYAYAIWENDTLLLMLDTNGFEWHYDLTANALIPLTPTAP